MPATFHFYIRENRPNKKGECPIYLRITHNRKLKYLNTGIRVDPNQWNPDKQEVRRSHRTYKNLNEELRSIYAIAEEARGELVRQKKVSADGIKQRMEYASKDNFFALSGEYLSEIRQRSYYTWKQSKVAFEKLKKFHGSEHLPLNFIDVTFLNNFIRFLQGEIYQNTASTVDKNIGAIRAVLDKAKHARLITHNPADSEQLIRPVDINIEEKAKLTHKQIQDIKRLKLEADSELFHCRNAFVMAFYFCGIRIGDLLSLKVKNVKGGKLKYRMNKTGNNINVKIPADVHPMVDSYTKGKTDTDWLLPFLSDVTEKQEADGEYLRRRISSYNTIINQKLEDIAAAAGIRESISTHVARHSFAQYVAEEKELSAYKIMVLLGHKSIQTTMNYLKKINVSVADNAMDEIF